MRAGDDLLAFVGSRRFGTVLADPPWRFENRTGKIAPEHHRLSRYGTLTVNEISELPISQIVDEVAHLYLWVPNALLPDGIEVLRAWGFTYKTNIVWHKVRKDGGSDGRGVGFYFRNVTELVLFGVKGRGARTLAPGRRQTNLIASRKREHSRKPDDLYDIIESCSTGPFVELFSRGVRDRWTCWGEEATVDYLFVTSPGNVPTKEQFLDIMRKISLRDADFNVDKFKPGSSGEALLFQTLKNEANIDIE